MPMLNKVVVCDDEDSIAYLLHMALGDAGYLCLRARDGQQALFLAEAEKPDLLILDVMLPNLDGIQVCHELRSRPHLSRIPVLMLTSLGSTDDKVRGLEAGADDYLAKPFDLRELLARVRALIRSHRRASAGKLASASDLEDAVEARIGTGEDFSVVHLSLVGHDRFTEAHGWRRGEELAGATARALQDRLPSGALLAHLGGGDFGLLVARPDLGLEATLAALESAAAEATLSFGEPAVTIEVTRVDGDRASTADGLARSLGEALRSRRQGAFPDDLG